MAPDATIGAGTRIWGLAQVRERAFVGAECIIGRGAYIGAGVRLGSRVKVQNLAQVYEPATVEDGVFIGPGAVLTNDQYPRAIRPDGELSRATDWEPVGVVLRTGASIGARAVCVAPVESAAGRWWPPVPWSCTTSPTSPSWPVTRHVGSGGSDRPGGGSSDAGEGRWRCPVTGELFTETEGRLREAEDHD